MKINNKYSIKSMIGAFGFAALALTITSCDQDVTDLQPYDRITETLAFETPDRCELSMVGVYDAAQSGFYDGGQIRGYPFGAANVAQGDNRGEDVLNVAAFYAITYEATYTPASANNSNQWHTAFGVINKANIVIEGVRTALSNGVLSAEAANAYEGEARFLRALSYHELLIHFARPYNHTGDASHLGVPYRTAPVNSAAALDSESTKGRNTVKECYDLMLEDLNFAESNLPVSRTGSLDVTRATKGAAIALKSRINLHKGDWAGVISESNKLLTGSDYSLSASPDGPFASNASNSESIFSIENAATDHPGVNGALPTMYSVAPGRALVAISPVIYNANWWLENDLRRSLLVNEAANGFFTHKYRDIVNNSDYNPILRLAEVVLNAAEAQARQGNSAAAVELLNQVRNRAVTEVADQFTEGSFGSANEVVEAIIKERRIEFLCEGRRWADIHRLGNDATFSTGGIPAKVLFGNTTKASWGYGVDHDGENYTGTLNVLFIPYDDFRFIWPIPQLELNSNPTLAGQQNPGY